MNIKNSIFRTKSIQIIMISISQKLWHLTFLHSLWKSLKTTAQNARGISESIGGKYLKDNRQPNVCFTAISCTFPISRFRCDNGAFSSTCWTPFGSKPDLGITFARLTIFASPSEHVRATIFQQLLAFVTDKIYLCQQDLSSTRVVTKGVFRNNILIFRTDFLGHISIKKTFYDIQVCEQPCVILQYFLKQMSIFLKNWQLNSSVDSVKTPSENSYHRHVNKTNWPCDSFQGNCFR